MKLVRIDQVVKIGHDEWVSKKTSRKELVDREKKKLLLVIIGSMLMLFNFSLAAILWGMEKEFLQVKTELHQAAKELGMNIEKIEMQAAGVE